MKIPTVDVPSMLRYLANNYENVVAKTIHPEWLDIYENIQERHRVDRWQIDVIDWVNLFASEGMECKRRVIWALDAPYLTAAEHDRLIRSFLSDGAHKKNFVFINGQASDGRSPFAMPFAVFDDALFFERPAHPWHQSRFLYRVAGIDDDTLATIRQSPKRPIKKNQVILMQGD